MVYLLYRPKSDPLHVPLKVCEGCFTILSISLSLSYFFFTHSHETHLFYITTSKGVCTCSCCVIDPAYVEPSICGCSKTCNNCKSRKRRKKKVLLKEGLEVPGDGKRYGTCTSITRNQCAMITGFYMQIPDKNQDILRGESGKGDISFVWSCCGAAKSARTDSHDSVIILMSYFQISTYF
jgi:hypothetical protein